MSEIMEKNLKGLKAEFHIIQSFPVTCLNRDDVGAPKSAVVGGVSRARVSSQCWKREIRLQMHALGAPMGIRTKKLGEMIERECKNLGASAEEALQYAQAVVGALGSDKKTINLDTLLFITPNEVKKLAREVKDKNILPSKEAEKEILKIFKTFDKQDCADVALFGRMVAKAAEANINAAASFSHAISTHKAANDIDFFTAVDDIQNEDETGSAHMGALEFNSATYYRYVSLDLGQLYENLMFEDELLFKSVENFVKALYLAVPAARQTTQAGYSPWDYGKIFIRRGQNLQASFEEPVKSKIDGGYSKPSIEALNKFLEDKERQAGSLFGKEAEFEIGGGSSSSVDDLIALLKKHIAG